MMTETELTADDLSELETGDELTVEYESEQGDAGNIQTFTATVEDVETRRFDGEVCGNVFLKRDENDISRRRLNIKAGRVKVEGLRISANGSTWFQMSPVTEVSVTTESEDEDSEDASEDPEPVTDGGSEISDSDGEFPTTALDYNGASGIPNTSAGANSYQQRMVGTIFSGQVLVDIDACEYDSDETAYEGYSGHTWKITNISEDSRWMTLRKRDGEDAGTERRLTVAAFARETIRGERWMFLKDQLLANTWSVQRGNPSHHCQNCGVTRDNALSREESFTTHAGGREWNATLRRCVGCHGFGVEALAEDDHRHAGQGRFTTGILEGPDAPWNLD